MYRHGSTPIWNAVSHPELFSSFPLRPHVPAGMDVATQAESWWHVEVGKASQHVKRYSQNQFLEVGINNVVWLSTKKDQAGEKSHFRQNWVNLHLVRCTKQLVEETQRTPTDCRQSYFCICRTKIKALSKKPQKTRETTLQQVNFFYQTISQNHH